jgi:hypothetical protein
MNEPVAYINVEKRALEWATPIKWETPTIVKMDKVPLYTAPPQQNEFNPDWDAMAVMVEEQQRMAKRIEELTQLVTSQGIRLMDAEAQPEPEEKKYTEESCPVCGYYCLGKGGTNCIDKPKLCGIDNAPPQREWRGLTYADLYFWGNELGLGELGKGVLRAVDAHLRKKNQ